LNTAGRDEDQSEGEPGGKGNLACKKKKTGIFKKLNRAYQRRIHYSLKTRKYFQEYFFSQALVW
jgi:hypothetical protein